jgi:hypothetical protein
VSQIVEHLPDTGPFDVRLEGFVDQRARACSSSSRQVRAAQALLT